MKLKLLKSDAFNVGVSESHFVCVIDSVCGAVNDLAAILTIVFKQLILV